MTRADIVELLSQDETVIFLEGPEFDRAIVGLVERFNQPRIVCYDYDAVIEALMGQGMEEEEAVEWFGFNIGGAWMGDTTPCFIRTGGTID